jgi:hypothetical protein
MSKIIRYWRVIAFCERSDSPLLWSHYANSYKGACLHFLSGGFSALKGTIGYVEYRAHRAIYPLSLALKLHTMISKDDSPILSKMESESIIFFNKALDWAYESEVRIVYNSNISSSVNFDKEKLLSIIVGPRIDGKTLDRIKAMIQSSHIPHLPIRTARLSNNSYSVEID